MSMAQDARAAEMTDEDEAWTLREDGYLNADVELTKIVYHPPLNVIVICTSSGAARVVDVNSGVVLQKSDLSGTHPRFANLRSKKTRLFAAQCRDAVTCRYIPGQDRILFCDGQALGVRSDYNGVLLLDTILQTPVANPRDDCKLELLLSEVGATGL